MRFSGRSLAMVVSSVALAHAALGQVQAPSEAPQEAPQPPAAVPENTEPAPKAPTLPNLEVIAPKKKEAAPKKKPAQPAVAKKAPTGPPPPTAVDLVPPARPAAAAAPEGVRMSPVGGSELPIDKVPAGVSVVPSAQIERAATASITEAINTYVPSATINEALGNALATDLQYRGFTASPLNGTPQGLAIYQNGVRMNEVFGDAMNWDLIPQIAIADIVMMSNNPAFGLKPWAAPSTSS